MLHILTVKPRTLKREMESTCLHTEHQKQEMENMNHIPAATARHF